jgi:hypothetical protein
MGDNFLTSSFLLRGLSVPPSDAYRYFEFFEGAEKMYFRNTILGLPFRTFEMDQISLVIGQNQWGYGSETNANAGVFATAYMHMGWLGMAVFPAIVGFTLRLLDKFSESRIPQEIAIALTAVVGMQYLSGDLTTTMLSGGLGLMLVVLLLIGRREEATQDQVGPVPQAVGWQPATQPRSPPPSFQGLQ